MATAAPHTPYATAYHAPVLCDAVVAHLMHDPSGCYVDGTLGGGGHTAALLDALGPDGHVIGIDQDPEALDVARNRLSEARAAGRCTLLRGNFRNLSALLADAGVSSVDGVLLDLGVSSHQIDEAARGFSFQQNGPLDMRMDPTRGLTAHQIVNNWPLADLRDVLRQYGEERRAHNIARAICRERPLDTTLALAHVVRGCVPPPDEKKTLARVFQGLRIAVNAELDVLETVLEQTTDVVRIGGRLAVLTYHSLEDRRVKRYLRDGNFEGTPRRDMYGNRVAPWTPVHETTATDDEVAANPRARSARLRVGQRRDTADVGPAMPQ
ncbi:16S rRNA (cytosine(1402)-N(4))-methyltransferase RsmH [Salisaeta longa]|uniref:16S rRNA (cytosine(1402)-N(4))-methyltransferase RsmH n=1 Tax=Salisaeta longa TaxID=503170 RepID=UPI0003B59AE2|nr:16S rRNA (cytosine(1402)-N(4))-methyltransferase RsmH [Salisaeta longa]